MAVAISTVSKRPHLPTGNEAIMVTAMSTQESLVAEVNAFLARHGMKPPDFGKLAMNDLGFVYRLRDGLDVRASTIDKLRRFMAEYDREHPLARRRPRKAEAARSAA